MVSSQSNEPRSSIRTVPVEIILEIADRLPSVKDVNSFARTHSALYASLNCYLYKRSACYDGSYALLWAMEGGPERTVHMALDAGVCPENIGETHSCFLAAIYRGYEAIVRRLFEFGVELNTPSRYSGFFMPLSQAVSYGNMGIIRFLLSSGADINLADGTGQTPLSCATSRGDESMVRLLLENGAYANAPGIFT